MVAITEHSAAADLINLFSGTTRICTSLLVMGGHLFAVQLTVYLLSVYRPSVSSRYVCVYTVQICVNVCVCVYSC